MRLTNSSMNQRGAVSLFVVIFATLLITIVTVSFLRFMVQGQQQISDQDLSLSALDSAKAGVQDASRGLLGYEKCLNSGGGGCGTPSDWASCNGIIYDQVYTNPNPSQGNPEVSIQKDITNESNPDQSLNQAYTCVTVNLDTSDVLESASGDISKLVPLKGTSTFTNVKIDWFTRDDLASGAANGYKVDLQSPATSPLPLLQQYNSVTKQGWSPNRPSLLRVQLIQYSANGGFSLSNFDDTTNGQSDANTLFLYPTGFSGTNFANYVPQVAPFTQDARRIPTGTPVGATCQGDLSAGGYSCSEILTLPTPTGGGDSTGYLRITPMYNASHYRVTLLSSPSPSDVVSFHNVQPTVDSTGRANDVFRRVQVRVDLLNNNLPYPTDAVDLTGNFCKDFAVTNNTADYASINTGSCKP
jgi:Tfp pilus assembly protein PilX